MSKLPWRNIEQGGPRALGAGKARIGFYHVIMIPVTEDIPLMISIWEGTDERTVSIF